MPKVVPITLTLSMSMMLWCGPPTGASPPREQLDKIVDDDPNPLPRYATPQEKLIEIRSPTLEDLLRGGPPSGSIHCSAEYEVSQGGLVRWGSFNSLLTEFIVGITEPDPGAIAYVLVTGASQQASATSTLTSNGADMSEVEFITYTSNTVWIRDYGPRYIWDDNTRAIVDHVYNRPRPLDDAFPQFLGNLWYEPVYDIPLVHGGGNFMLTATGDAFMSSLILEENPGLTEQQIKDYYLEYQNLNLTIYPGFPSNIDSTAHIDMWMMVLSDTDILISQFWQMPETYPARQITDDATTDLIARGYIVWRVPALNSGPGGYNGVHYTYTNSVIFNDRVFVPYYGGTHAPRDAEALAVYQAAMPDHTIIPVYCGTIIPSAGAIHCVVMHVPAYTEPIPSVKVLSPNGGEFWSVGGREAITWAANDDVGITNVDIYYSTDGGMNYEVIATQEPHDGDYQWIVPDVVSMHCLVRVVVHDADLNQAEDVSDAEFAIISGGPELVHEFNMDQDPGWSTQGLWAWGQPTGGGGQHGEPDPTGGYTGANVYGYNLSGDYESGLPERHLTTAPIDCTGMFGLQLAFRRWLGVEQPSYDHAYVRVSNNGTDWVTIWENTGEVADESWSLQEFDVSSVADNQATVYLRWTMGTTDSIWQYCGWNIDDVELWAIIPYVSGDFDGDSDADLDDYAVFADCLAGPDVTTPPDDCDPDDFATADFDGDEDVDMADIQAFCDVFTG